MVGALVGSGCGSSTTAVRVGDRSLDRDGLMVWVSDRTGVETGMTIPSGMVVDTIDEWIVNESLADLLAEHGWTPDDKARNSARDQLLVAGIDPEDPRLPTYIDWQAVRARAASGGPEVRAAYEAHLTLLSHELCTSHVLVASEADAREVLDLLGSGRPFAEVARALSQDPGSAARGGALGCVPLGSLVPTFERATLGALRDGKTLVGPVPSQFGFHVIRIDEVRRVDPVPFAELDQRRSAALLQIAGLTRTVEVESRYGTWDAAVGRVASPPGPLAPALARLGS